MAKKPQKHKNAGRHNTLISLAQIAMNALIVCDAVVKVSPGVITSGLTVLRGKRRIKVTVPQTDMGSILVTIRDVRSMQELRVYGELTGIQTCLRQCAEKNDLQFTIS
jgi:hypothetical protein